MSGRRLLLSYGIGAVIGGALLRFWPFSPVLLFLLVTVGLVAAMTLLAFWRGFRG